MSIDSNSNKMYSEKTHPCEFTLRVFRGEYTVKSAERDRIVSQQRLPLLRLHSKDYSGKYDSK